MQFVNSGRFGLVINTRSQHGDHIKYANAFISNKKYGNLWTHVLNTRHAVISHEEYGNHHQICFEYYDDATICQRSCFLIFRKQLRTFLPQVLWSICDSISLVCGLWAFRSMRLLTFLFRPNFPPLHRDDVLWMVLTQSLNSDDDLRTGITFYEDWFGVKFNMYAWPAILPSNIIIKINMNIN